MKPITPVLLYYVETVLHINIYAQMPPELEGIGINGPVFGMYVFEGIYEIVCAHTVKILKFGTPQTIAIIVLKIEKFDVTLH